MNSTDIRHYAGCNANYPEKPSNEKPKQVIEIKICDGFKSLICVDCGAEVNDLPPEDDPYWDEVKEELAT